MQNFSPFFYKNLNRIVKCLIYRFFDEAGVAESGKTQLPADIYSEDL
jgi:hypothetical protein